MNTHPLISIIIPVYNAGKYLPQCLDSVVNQTYKNIEVILVNDGSSDGSETICQRYANDYPHINYIKRENAGASASRNYGVGIAKGEYIFFLDSDDYLKADCLANMVDVANTGKLVVTGYILDDVTLNSIYIPQQYDGCYNSVKEFLLEFNKYFATKFNFPWGKLFRKDIIIKNCIRFIEGMSLSEDVLFNIEYYKHCSKGVILLEDKGYYYRQSDNSTLSKRFNPKMFEWNETAYSIIRDYLKEQDAMTPQNRTHFYTNVLGNLFYSMELLSVQKNIRQEEKVKLIKEYAYTELSREVYSFSISSSLRSRLMVFLLKHHWVNIFILINQLMSLVKKIV